MAPTDGMHNDDPLERLRVICADLPHVTEKEAWGEPHFYVRGKVFASCGNKTGFWRVVVEAGEEQTTKLVDADPGRYEPYPHGKGLVAIEIYATTDWNELERLVLSSYHRNAGTAIR